MTIGRTEINGMRILLVIPQSGYYSVLLHRENGPFPGRPFVGANSWNGEDDEWDGGTYDMDWDAAMAWVRHRTPIAREVISIP